MIPAMSMVIDPAMPMKNGTGEMHFPIYSISLEVKRSIPEMM